MTPLHPHGLCPPHNPCLTPALTPPPPTITIAPCMDLLTKLKAKLASKLCGDLALSMKGLAHSPCGCAPTHHPCGCAPPHHPHHPHHPCGYAPAPHPPCGCGHLHRPPHHHHHHHY